MKTAEVIENWVSSGSRILDLGCGDGSILETLKLNKSVGGYGIEIDKENIQACLEKGLEVIEQNIDGGLSNFQDKSFDTVLVSQTIQVLKNPKQALDEITRIGHQSIIAIPNFGHWKSRLTVFFPSRCISNGIIPPSLQAIIKSLFKIVELSPDSLIFFAFIIFILSPL